MIRKIPSNIIFYTVPDVYDFIFNGTVIIVLCVKIPINLVDK